MMQDDSVLDSRVGASPPPPTHTIAADAFDIVTDQLRRPVAVQVMVAASSCGKEGTHYAHISVKAMR